MMNQKTLTAALIMIALAAFALYHKPHSLPTAAADDASDAAQASKTDTTTAASDDALNPAAVVSSDPCGDIRAQVESLQFQLATLKQRTDEYRQSNEALQKQLRPTSQPGKQPVDFRQVAVVSSALRSPEGGGDQNVRPAHIYDENTAKPVVPAADLLVQMLAENNRIRAAAGKSPQTLDERLCRAAQDQADYMARYHQPVIINGVISSPSYSHDTNGGSRARLARAGFHWTDYAENLNLSTPGHPDDSWQSWRGSAPHYGSMLRPFPLAGFGQAEARDGTIYSAALYGTESSAAVAPREAVRSAPQVFSSCGPNGCGVQQYQRRGFFGRR